jgi:two-component system cell cycle sensor histidine kinase PleC
VRGRFPVELHWHERHDVVERVRGPTQWGAQAAGRGAEAGMTAERDREAIARARWKVLLRNLPPALLGNAAAALVLGGALWATGDVTTAILWTLGALAVLAVRYTIWRVYRRRAVAGRHPQRARRMLIAGNALGGGWWGIGLPIVMPLDHSGLITLMGVFASGLIAGSMASAAAVPTAFLAFTICLAGPIAAYFAAQATVTGVALGAAILVFSGIMISVALNMARQTREILEMRSARKDMIRDLADARDKAEASDLAKSRFLATMSHELRTPLNIILGFAQSIEQRLLGPLGDDRYAEYAGTIRESGEHLLALINDVLDLSRVGAGQYRIEPERVAVADLVDEVRRSMGDESTRQKVTVFTTVEPDVPDVWADRRALRQILLNLLSNAIKFTPMGGNVHMSATHDAAAASVRVIVSDTGVGIPPAQQDKVLQPFVQADSDSRRRYQGTGLGLALSKELTELQNGRLRLESAEGEGTTVTLALPVAQPADGDALVPQPDPAASGEQASPASARRAQA